MSVKTEPLLYVSDIINNHLQEESKYNKRYRSLLSSDVPWFVAELKSGH
jgi:hypothetical protein